jgi:hypothetical protein
MPFPLEDTQAYLAASDRMIVVAFVALNPRRSETGYRTRIHP